MPRNGSGTYSLPAGNPVVTNTVISSTWANTTLSDLGTGLTNSIAKDGQTTPTANLPMGGFKLTGMGVGNANTDSLTLGQAQNQVFMFLATVAGTNTITATTAPVTTSYVAGQTYRFVPAVTNTSATTININSLGAKNIFSNGVALLGGELVATSTYEITYDGTQFGLNNAFSPNAQPTVTAVAGDYVVLADASDALKSKKALISDILTLASIRNYFTGGVLSTAGSSTTMSVAAWFGSDSTNARLFSTVALAKTTSSWVVGDAAGGKSQSGAAANNTWYHFYSIYRPDTGVSDICFSTNATGLAAGDFVAGGGNVADAYTQWRYLGSGFTNGSAQWRSFSQVGNTVLWDVAVIDFDVTNPGTSAVSRTLSTPLGLKTIAIINTGYFGGTSGGANGFRVSSLDTSDQAPQNSQVTALTLPNNSGVTPGTATWNMFPMRIRTNTSSQIRTRLFVSGAADKIGCVTDGYEYIRD